MSRHHAMPLLTTRVHMKAKWTSVERWSVRIMGRTIVSWVDDMVGDLLPWYCCDHVIITMSLWNCMFSIAYALEDMCFCHLRRCHCRDFVFVFVFDLFCCHCQCHVILVALIVVMLSCCHYCCHLVSLLLLFLCCCLVVVDDISPGWNDTVFDGGIKTECKMYGVLPRRTFNNGQWQHSPVFHRCKTSANKEDKGPYQLLSASLFHTGVWRLIGSKRRQEHEVSWSWALIGRWLNWEGAYPLSFAAVSDTVSSMSPMQGCEINRWRIISHAHIMDDVYRVTSSIDGRCHQIRDGPLASVRWSASISVMIVEMKHDGGTPYYRWGDGRVDWCVDDEWRQ